MGSDVYGTLCYGVILSSLHFEHLYKSFEECEDAFFSEATHLWLIHKKFKATVIDDLGYDGNFFDYNITEEDYENYDAEIDAWIKENSIPFEIVIADSFSFPTYIIARKNSWLEANQRSIEKVDHSKLDINAMIDNDDMDSAYLLWKESKAYDEFLKELGITEKPCWLLSALFAG